MSNLARVGRLARRLQPGPGAEWGQRPQNAARWAAWRGFWLSPGGKRGSALQGASGGREGETYQRFAFGAGVGSQTFTGAKLKGAKRRVRPSLGPDRPSVSGIKAIQSYFKQSGGAGKFNAPPDVRPLRDQVMRRDDDGPSGQGQRGQRAPCQTRQAVAPRKQ